MSELNVLKKNIFNLFQQTESICASKASLERPDLVIAHLDDIARINKRLLAVQMFINEVAGIYARHPDIDAIELRYSSKAYQDEVPGPVHHEYDVVVTGSNSNRDAYAHIELDLLTNSNHVQYIRLVAGAQEHEDVDLAFAFTRNMISESPAPAARYETFCKVAPLLADELGSMIDVYASKADESMPSRPARPRVA